MLNQLVEGHQENNVVCQADGPEIKYVQVIDVPADRHERYCKMALTSFYFSKGSYVLGGAILYIIGTVLTRTNVQVLFRT